MYLLDCFAAGAQQVGDEVVLVDERSYQPGVWDEIAVGVQVCYPNRHQRGRTAELGLFRLKINADALQRRRRMLTIDTGFLRSQSDAELARRLVKAARSRGRTERVHQPAFSLNDPRTYPAFDECVYYSVGYDGLKNYADYGLDDTLRVDRWRQLDLRLQHWRTKGRHILLIGQPLNGQSSQHVDIYDWYVRTVQEIRAQTDRPVLFRPHPRIFTIRTSKQRKQRDRALIQERLEGVQYSLNRHLREDLVNCWAVVVLTSNAAVEAVVAGYPVFALDHGCMAWDVANKSLTRLEAPKLPERESWAYRLAYAQWNCAELRRGDCWRHLRPHALKERRLLPWSFA
jgi:hypothetical protein